jgi:hypothetical protein
VFLESLAAALDVPFGCASRWRGRRGSGQLRCGAVVAKPCGMKRPSKLTLRRETVKSLSENELRRVGGGGRYTVGECTDVSCISDCLCEPPPPPNTCSCAACETTLPILTL